MKLLVNGIELYYELHGKGKPLVLIGGFTSDVSLWRTVLHTLSSHYQVLVFDNRGSGQSSSPDEPYKIEDMAQDVISLILELKLEKPHILGHSMGGAIAQTIAHRHGDLIDKLIICNSMIRLGFASRLMKNRMIERRRANTDPMEIIETKLPWIFSKDFLQDKARVEELTSFELMHPYSQSFVGFKRQLDALFDFDSRKWHHQIPHQTLVIGSEEDAICLQDTTTLGKNIPNAQFVNFPKVGHAPHLEKPHEFKHAVCEFLR